MDIVWVHIKSWHAVRNMTRVPGRVVTVCGRSVTGDLIDALPAGKSCESCLRILARSADGG